MALGVGASTAIFSAVNPILFEPLPYPRADRLVSLWDRARDGAPLAVTFGTYRELAARAHSFERLAVCEIVAADDHWGRATGALPGQRVSATYFRALGVAPAFGRDFDAADDRPGGIRVAILSDGVWRRRFGADSAIIGRQVTLDDDEYIVIGVMPRDFENVPGPSAELWSLLQYAATAPSDGPEWGHNLRMIGRLHEGTAIEQASREPTSSRETPSPSLHGRRGQPCAERSRCALCKATSPQGVDRRFSRCSAPCCWCW